MGDGRNGGEDRGTEEERDRAGDRLKDPDGLSLIAQRSTLGGEN